MIATTYRRKPLVFEAVRWDSDPAKHDAVSAWVRASGQAIRVNVSNGDLYISTREGGVCARPGDYVVRGVEGEVYPVIERRFKLLYEEVHP